jgi:hypothetical protein
MPSKELLEEFLRGMGGPVTVVFDTRAGAFVRVRRTREVVADRVLST